MAVQPGKPGIGLQQRAIGHRLSLRPGPPQPGRRHIGQVRVQRPQVLRPQPKSVHHPGGEILDQNITARRQGTSDLHRLGLLQIQHDRPLGLPQHGMQFGRPPRIAAPRRLHLDHVRAHRRQIPRGRRPGDHPTEIQHPHTRKRHRPHRPRHRRPIGQRQPERGPRRLHHPATDREVPEIPPMRQLPRPQMLHHLHQREARHMRVLRQVGDRLLVEAPAPLRHQCVQRIPVRRPVGLGPEPRLLPPGR